MSSGPWLPLHALPLSPLSFSLSLPQTVAALEELGVDLTLKATDGHTVLMFCAGMGFTEVRSGVCRPMCVCKCCSASAALQCAPCFGSKQKQTKARQLRSNIWPVSHLLPPLRTNSGRALASGSGLPLRFRSARWPLGILLTPHQRLALCTALPYRIISRPGSTAKGTREGRGVSASTETSQRLWRGAVLCACAQCVRGPQSIGVCPLWAGWPCGGLSLGVKEKSQRGQFAAMAGEA